MSAGVDTKEWVLDPETEYRFELDPGTTLAIKVFHLVFCRLEMRITVGGTLASQRPRRNIWSRARCGRLLPLWL